MDKSGHFGALAAAELTVLLSEWRASENGRRARYYRLSALGRKQLETETRSWETFILAVRWVLESA